jgi:hypothetical protein
VDDRVGGSWDALVTHIGASALPIALVSQEGLALVSPRQARRAVESFKDAEVQVIVTARDLGRVLVSMWQEEIKSDGTWTWRDYAEAVRDPGQTARQPAFGFWRRQDLVRVCDAWGAAVGVDHVHVVTVPQEGSAPEELLHRVASVVGFDSAWLTHRPVRYNEMVGVAEIELLRQINTRLGGRLNEPQRARAIRGALIPIMEQRQSQAKAGLPPQELDWVTARADEMIAAIEDRGYEVTGDVGDLRPRPRTAMRNPADSSVDELYDTAVDVLTQLTERYARAWWLRQRKSDEESNPASRMPGDLRGRTYLTKLRVLEMTERSRLASRALAIVLRAEQRQTRRVRRRTARKHAGCDLDEGLERLPERDERSLPIDDGGVRGSSQAARDLRR